MNSSTFPSLQTSNNDDLLNKSFEKHNQNLKRLVRKRSFRKIFEVYKKLFKFYWDSFLSSYHPKNPKNFFRKRSFTIIIFFVLLPLVSPFLIFRKFLEPKFNLISMEDYDTMFMLALTYERINISINFVFFINFFSSKFFKLFGNRKNYSFKDDKELIILNVKNVRDYDIFNFEILLIALISIFYSSFLFIFKNLLYAVFGLPNFFQIKEFVEVYFLPLIVQLLFATWRGITSPFLSPYFFVTLIYLAIVFPFSCFWIKSKRKESLSE